MTQAQPIPNLEVAADRGAWIEREGLTGEAVFTDPRIVAWRTLPDRQNCTLDIRLHDGRALRLHVKRYAAARGGTGSTPAHAEARGHELLQGAGIPTAPLVTWGVLPDGRSYAVFEDLAGYMPGDKLVEAGVPFERVLRPTADVAAACGLCARLHHRDLYLCHFMVRLDADAAEVKLIDTARVARMANPLTRRRWVVKDLAQFWYSTMKLPAGAVSDEQRERWLRRYAERRGMSERAVASLRAAIERKAARIGRHDVRLNRKQPTRNVSIPANP